MNAERSSLRRLTARSLLLAVALLGAAACSISTSPSDSSKSSSDSSESSSDSSASSSPSDKTSAYRDDVRDYTAAYVKSGGGIAEFDRKLGDLAKSRGISNWEDDPATYEGIGQGLGKARVSKVELDTYAQNLAHGDKTKAATIQKGYASYKP